MCPPEPPGLRSVEEALLGSPVPQERDGCVFSYSHCESWGQRLTFPYTLIPMDGSAFRSLPVVLPVPLEP